MDLLDEDKEMNVQATTQIAQYLNVNPDLIKAVEEWAHVLFVRFTIGSPRFVSKKIVKKMEKLKLQFMGDCVLRDRYYYGFVVTCRRDDQGKRALGLDCHMGYDYRTQLKSLGAKWDGRDQAWYFTFNTPDAVAQMVATIKRVMEDCECWDGDRTPQLGYEQGIVGEAQVANYFRKVCVVNSEA